MADTKSKEERSKNMSHIRSKNTSIEIKVLQLRQKVSYRGEGSILK